MKTSIILVTYNNLAYTESCVSSIREHTKQLDYELIAIDNASSDGSAEWLSRQDDIQTVINRENRGFAAGCNQGIRAAHGENILLLNNDTIVTHNWLTNLLKCLYSAENIGAVGAVSNNAHYYQTIESSYQTPESMHEFAKRHNVSNPELWEPRIKLTGFCMLIKKEVIEKIGLLDETFFPGNYEDDDYSVRMINAGYRMMLCKDTFVHHHGGVSFKEAKLSGTLSVNAKRFEDKWGFNLNYHGSIRQDVIDLIDARKDEAINVLEIGCGAGATLLKIKSLYRNANVYGIELNKKLADVAGALTNIRCLDIEQAGDLDYPEGYFHYILFADVLEYLRNPYQVLKSINRYLAHGGSILASIPNVMHYARIGNLIRGYWSHQEDNGIYKTPVRFFTAHEIVRMFSGAGYINLNMKPCVMPYQQHDGEFMRALCRLVAEDRMLQQYETYQYLVTAKKA